MIVPHLTLNFRFGPDGLKLRPAEPLPVVEAESTEEEDDDDFFGLASDDDEDDDDEDDEEDDRPSLNSVPDASGIDDAQDADDEDDDDDLLGLGALLDIFTGDDDATTKRPRPTTVAPLLQFTIPILTRPTTPAPLEDYELSTSANNVPVELNNDEDSTQEPVKLDEDGETESVDNNNEDITDENQEEEVTESSNKIVYYAKPDKVELPNKVKKGVIGDKKKPTVTSTSINAIDEPEKPAKKPIKDENEDEDDDDDDEDAILDDDDDDDEILDDDDDYDKDDEDEEDEDKFDDEKFDDDEDEKAEDFDDLDDEDDEEDEAMLTAIMGTGKNKKNNKGDTTKGPNADEDDYGLGLGFLARKRHLEGNRQSKITRL